MYCRVLHRLGISGDLLLRSSILRVRPPETVRPRTLLGLAALAKPWTQPRPLGRAKAAAGESTPRARIPSRPPVEMHKTPGGPQRRQSNESVGCRSPPWEDSENSLLTADLLRFARRNERTIRTARRFASYLQYGAFQETCSICSSAVRSGRTLAVRVHPCPD